MRKWSDLKREKLSPEQLEALRQQAHDRVVRMTPRALREPLESTREQLASPRSERD